jgi:hypothetical protein
MTNRQERQRDGESPRAGGGWVGGASFSSVNAGMGWGGGDQITDCSALADEMCA